MFFRLNRHLLACAGGVFTALIVVSATHLRAQSGSMPERSTTRLSLSPVILAERPGAVQEMTADPRQVRHMVNEALLKLTSAPDIATAWTRLGITPRDVVGIKIDTVGGSGLCTHHSLVKAICDGLHAAGVPFPQIIIWDKYQDRMNKAGYAQRSASDNYAAITSITANNSFDPAVFYKNEIVGNLIWGDFQFLQSVSYNDNGSNSIANRSYYTTFVTHTCTKLINVPVLTNNRLVGINGCLASLALGSVDNNRRFQGPSTYGDPAIDEILDEDFMRRKVVVHILDALVAQCAGGPGFNPQFCQSLGALYVSRDPVAIDSLVLPRLEKWRRIMNVPPIGNTASHVKDGVNYNLGTNDRRRIQLVRVP